jgi:hypothetical protein
MGLSAQIFVFDSRFIMAFLSRFAHRRQAELSNEAMQACEQINSEVGADPHDALIQKLSVLRLHLDKIERSSFDRGKTPVRR